VYYAYIYLYGPCDSLHVVYYVDPVMHPQ